MAQHQPADEWPPQTTIDKGVVARMFMHRLRKEHKLGYVNYTAATLTDRGWLARVGIWPYNDIGVEAVQSALAPIEVDVFPHGPSRAFGSV